MIPDAKWLDALKLPVKAKAAVALSCATILALFKVEFLTLGDADQLVQAGLTIAAVVFGILVLSDGISWLAKPIISKKNAALIADRRRVRRLEKREEAEEAKINILLRLDSLSDREKYHVVEALRAGSPTFYAYVHSPSVSMLLGKRLVWTPGGQHHQDHFPFSFEDFVWDELVRRKAEFIQEN